MFCLCFFSQIRIYALLYLYKLFVTALRCIFISFRMPAEVVACASVTARLAINITFYHTQNKDFNPLCPKKCDCKFKICNFQTCINYWYFDHFLYNCPEVRTTWRETLLKRRHQAITLTNVDKSFMIPYGVTRCQWVLKQFKCILYLFFSSLNLLTYITKDV